MAASSSLKPRQWSIEATEAFEPVALASPWGPLQSTGELLHGCFLFEFEHRDQRALVAMSRARASGGTRVHVQGLVSLGAPLQMQPLMSQIEQTALDMGGDVLTMLTRHHQMARLAPKWGAHIAGAAIAKHLKVH